MLTHLIDCDCLLGRPKVPLPDVTPTVDDVLSEMDRLGVTRALARHRACVEAAPELGNALLLDEIAGQERLLPMWYVTVDGLEGAFDPAAMVDELLRRGARAAWTTVGGSEVPVTLDPWLAGDMLAALEAHRIPLFLLFNQHAPKTLDEVLTAFPQLPVVFCQVRRSGRNEVLWALLQRHANAYLCAHAVFSVHRGLEALCRDFGAERILFGSGYPVIEGGASLAGLTYADIPWEAKEAIAWRNIERILGEVTA